ncbi:MAG: DNA-binding protein [Bacteroidaceae bacterium]|nr:DNA-binding protein [Bacteroidaceae bacterium]
MARYIKQELPDLHKTGEKKAYYRMKTERKIDFNQFIDLISSHNSGISKGEAFSVLMHATDTLAELLAQGYSVAIDELGTFKATVGLVRDKEMDSFEEGTPKLNARSLRVDGVSFKADKRLIVNVDKRCELKRAGVSLLCRSTFTKEERLQKALEYLNAHGAMKVKDYMELTGLSHTVAAKELREFENDTASGITSIGRLAGKVYVRRMEE